MNVEQWSKVPPERCAATGSTCLRLLLALMPVFHKKMKIMTICVYQLKYIVLVDICNFDEDQITFHE